MFPNCIEGSISKRSPGTRPIRPTHLFIDREAREILNVIGSVRPSVRLCVSLPSAAKGTYRQIWSKGWS